MPVPPLPLTTADQSTSRYDYIDFSSIMQNPANNQMPRGESKGSEDIHLAETGKHI